MHHEQRVVVGSGREAHVPIAMESAARRCLCWQFGEHEARLGSGGRFDGALASGVSGQLRQRRFVTAKLRARSR
jgi:hypothetical protein